VREVVIDTNVIFKNWYLDGPSMAVIERLIASGQCKLIVPEIVLLEVQNLYTEKMGELIGSIKKVNGLIRDKRHAVKVPDIKAVCSQQKWDSLPLRIMDTSEATALLPGGSIIVPSCL